MKEINFIFAVLAGGLLFFTSLALFSIDYYERYQAEHRFDGLGPAVEWVLLNQ